MDRSKKDNHFWTSTTGVLTAVTALIGLVTAGVTLYKAAKGEPVPKPAVVDEATTLRPSIPSPRAPDPVRTRSVAEWAAEANAECRKSSSTKAVEAMSQLDLLVRTTDFTDPRIGNTLFTLTGILVDVHSRLRSLPMPTERESEIVDFLSRYGERVRQFSLAYSRYGQGDLSGAGDAMIAAADIGEGLELTADKLGLNTCP
jgi:hypothetical protein